MATGVEELLDMLFDTVDEAKNVPLSGDKCMLERDKVLDLIDDIRSQFPMLPRLTSLRRRTTSTSCAVRAAIRSWRSS